MMRFVWLIPVLLWLPSVGSTSEQSLRELLDQLQHSTEVRARLRAVEAIAHYEEAAVPSLRRLLDHEDQRVRCYACSALIRLGPHAREATPDLVAIVSDPEEIGRTREDAMLALAQIGPAAASAVPVLQRLLREDSCPDLWRRAVSALAAIATPEAVTTLTESFEHGRRKDREAILFALQCQGEPMRSALPALLSVVARRPHDEVGDEVFLAAVDFGRDAVNDLTPYLQSPIPENRRRAAWTLSRLGPEAIDAVTHLSDALQDETAYVRFWAVKALGSIGPDASQAISLLLPMLDDTDPNVRWAAVLAIVEIDPAVMVEDTWNRLLNDADPGVRQRAASIRSTIW